MILPLSDIYHDWENEINTNLLEEVSEILIIENNILSERMDRHAII